MFSSLLFFASVVSLVGSGYGQEVAPYVTNAPVANADHVRSAQQEAAPLSASQTNYTVSIAGSTIFLNGPQGSKPFQVLGLRCSNALISDAKVDELIDNLDAFKQYGINSVSVFFMGSRFGDIKGYNPDATLNPIYRDRMGRIIEAADARGMVVLVGCFYWGTSSAKEDLGSWGQAEANAAVANTVQWLSDNNYRNVMVDIDNEGMAYRAKGWSMQQIITAGHQVDPTIMLGNNTPGNTSTNEDFNCHFGPKEADKPYFDSESTPNGYWGTYSKQDYNSSGGNFYNYSRIGAYTAAAKDQMRSTSRFSDRNGAMFASTWLQCGPAEGIDGPFMRPGGNSQINDVNENTDEVHPDAGIRWWLEWAKTEYGSWNPDPASGTSTPQLSFSAPEPGQTLAPGDDLYVKIENASEVRVNNMKLFLNDVFVRQENSSPWEWGASSQNDPLLQNLTVSQYTLRVVATDEQGEQTVVETTITVGSSSPLSFVEPMPSQTFAPGDAVYVAVESTSAIDVKNMKLYLDDSFVRQENFAPWEWGLPTQNDLLLQNLAPGQYALRVVATSKQGGQTAIETTITVGDTDDGLTGTYRLRHVATSKYLDSKSDNTVIGLEANGDVDQQWKFTSAGSDTYTLDNAKAGRGLLEAQSDGNIYWTAQETQTSNNQLWQVEETNDTYRLKNQATQGYLVIENDVARWSADATEAAEWELEALSFNARQEGSSNPKEAASELDKARLFMAYPNPATTVVHVAGLTAPQSTLRIKNKLGQVVLTQSVRGASTDVELRGISAGLYFVVVEQGNQWPATRKLLIQ